MLRVKIKRKNNKPRKGWKNKNNENKYHIWYKNKIKSNGKKWN
jgi:hypothetical protein